MSAPGSDQPGAPAPFGAPFGAPVAGAGGAPAGDASVEKPKASVVRYKAALRKSIRRNKKEHEVDFLNITAMLDLMTIILVFLLKSLAASSGSIPQSKDLTLPFSVMSSEPAQEGVVVIVSKSVILVGDDPTPLVQLPSREQLVATGVDPNLKQNGVIVPLANALRHAREIDEKIRKAKNLDPNGSEAILVADSTTPYRLLVEVLYTLGESQFKKYHLVVQSGKKQ